MMMTMMFSLLLLLLLLLVLSLLLSLFHLQPATSNLQPANYTL